MNYLTKKLVLMCCLALGGITGLFAQNQFQSNQYMIYQPLVNFAAASSYQSTNFGLFYRNQWVGIDKSPVVLGMNASMPLEAFNSTVGIGALQDNIGIHKNTELSVHYAYTLSTGSKSRLSFSLSPVVKLLQNNYELIETTDAGDPVFIGNSSTVTTPNFKFGTYYYRDGFYAGFAVPNILRDDVVSVAGSDNAEVDFHPENMNLFFHSGYQIDVHPKHAILASVFVRETQGSPLHADFNLMWELDRKLGIGGAYKTSDEIVAIIKLSILKGAVASYSYQYSLSEIGDYNNGSHEVMIVYQFEPKKQRAFLEVPRF